MFEGIVDVKTIDQCTEACYFNDACEYWTYNRQTEFCSMFSTFIELVDSSVSLSGKNF